jgi:gephyrin
VDLLLTSGGTGFGIRDGTPEAVRPLLHREAPGIAQALLNEGLKFTPLAVMSRPVVGTRHSTFIATLPGRYTVLFYLCCLLFYCFKNVFAV